MAWLKRPRDTGDIDITSTLSDITAGLAGGPVRISTSGEIVVYRHSGTIRGLVTWYTRDPMPAGGA